MRNPQHPARRSPRLKDYDYSQHGAYFVTICTHNRINLFGSIDREEMTLNPFGEVVKQSWFELPKHYLNLELDEFVVMPNHVHGIIVLTTEVHGREGLRPSPTAESRRTNYGLTEIVRAFKSFSARHINVMRNMSGTSVWQRSFHDHIIRNERQLNILREYTIYNPVRWAADTYHEI